METERPSKFAQIQYANNRVKQLEQLIADNAGLQSVSVNGTSTTYLDLLNQRTYWLAELARLEGRTARTKTIRLGGG
jgi:hypothetical protein